MLKKAGVLWYMGLFVALLSGLGFAQEAKESRVEGRIVRSNPDKSTLTVRVRDTNSEKTVVYDASTKWGSQYHGQKKVNAIDASQVKDGDQVICLGSYDDKGELHATAISKRLSHSPQ
ncbi:MAG: hypothetical protein JO159_01945 [Acidobacteria bacterium]|nr:hypothetical protein [Acidobacteriota bacterium]